MLYPHQVEGINFLRTAKYGLLGDEQGLGKTLQALKAVEDCQKILIVCPAFLRGTWRREAEKWINRDSSTSIPSVEEDTYIYIVSYAGLGKCSHLSPNAVIFDESHYLKNVKAKRTLHAHSFIGGKKPEFCVLLSGTPVKNSIVEFFSPLRLLSHAPSGSNGLKLECRSQYDFSYRYSNPVTKRLRIGGRMRDVTEFKGSRNLPELKGILKGKYLRRTSKEVLDLPPIIDREISIDAPKRLSEELRKAFESVESEGVDRDKHFSTVKKEFALKKVPATTALATDLLDQGEQVVIFTDHVDPVAEIADTLHPTLTGCITGNTPTEDRDRLVEEFQKGEIRVLIATIGSASTGFTLTAARNMIFNDIPWGYVDLIQARKRIHRVGQDRSCVVSFIVAGDVDRMILKKIKEKGINLKEAL